MHDKFKWYSYNNHLHVFSFSSIWCSLEKLLKTVKFKQLYIIKLSDNKKYFYTNLLTYILYIIKLSDNKKYFYTKLSDNKKYFYTNYYTIE